MAIFSSPEDMEMIAFMCNQNVWEYELEGITIITTEQDRSNYMAWYAKQWAARLKSDPEKLENRRASRRKSEAKRRAAKHKCDGLCERPLTAAQKKHIRSVLGPGYTEYDAPPHHGEGLRQWLPDT